MLCDGREIGETPLNLPFAPGRHEVSARWNGRDARVRTITLPEAGEQTVSFDFRTASSPPKSKGRRSNKKEDDSVFSKVGRSVKDFFTGEKR